LVLAATPAVALGSGDLGAEPKPPDSSNSCRGNGRNACPAPAEAAVPAAPAPAAVPAAPVPTPEPEAPDAPRGSVPVSPTLASTGVFAAEVPMASEPVVSPAPAQPAGQGRRAVGRAESPGSRPERSFITLFVLGMLALAFLALQGRFDRRDPRLGAPSADARDDSLRFR